ncbi:MAG TPA: crotonase/enoyl-CoA hydratase family protein [Mariprofundaceae bacterium]|nr:crotonase/enoyl-CoA hydratase family protein [Mariprofundaceae bacterium]
MKHFQNSLRNDFAANHEPEYSTLEIHYEHDVGLAWYYMHPMPRPCVTPVLVQDIRHWFGELGNDPELQDVRYIVLASKVPGVFNLGGDLELFTRFIRNQDREALLGYAIACIDTMLLNHNGLNRGMTTISLAQGDTLGGGLEYAISSDVFIAERSAKMGLPDILFNMFPGIGAYSFLSRKVGAKFAEEMITSGRLYSAEQLHEIGVVDVLAEDGQGEIAVHDYISREEKARNGLKAFRAAKKCTNPVTREELVEVAQIWADAAMQLRDKDLRMMERLVARQNARV